MKLYSAVAVATLSFFGPVAFAQTASTGNDTVTAYGTRLANPADLTKGLNQRRINNRVNSRMQSRLATRLERYSIQNPDESYQQQERTLTQSFDQASDASKVATASTAASIQQKQFVPYSENVNDAGSR